MNDPDKLDEDGLREGGDLADRGWRAVYQAASPALAKPGRGHPVFVSGRVMSYRYRF